MKKIFYSVCAMLAVAFAVSCEEAKPEPLGNVQLSAAFDDAACTHNSGYGWLEGDKIGLFVVDANSGVQANLEYTPVNTTPEGFDPLGEVAFKAEKVDATLDQPGAYTFVAYYPYSENVTDYTAVPLPNLASQEDQFSVNFNAFPYNKYVFAYASIVSQDCNSSVVSLGNFKSVNTLMLVTNSTPDASLYDKSVTKITVTANKNIASKAAFINLVTGEISGEFTNTIEYTFNSEQGMNMISEPTPYGGGFPTAYGLLVTLDEATALNTDFTVTYTVDGIDYAMTAAKPTKGYMGLSLDLSSASSN